MKIIAAAIAIHFATVAPAYGCDALRALATSGVSLAAPDLARVYAIALDVASQHSGFDRGDLLALAVTPLSSPETFPFELKKLWGELGAAFSKADAATREEAMALVVAAFAERLGESKKIGGVREDNREATRRFTPSSTNWTDARPDRGAVLDPVTRATYSAPLPQPTHWTIHESGRGWNILDQGTRVTYFWYPTLGKIVKAKTAPFWSDSWLHRSARSVEPKEIKISTTPDGSLAVVTAFQTVKYWWLEPKMRSQVSIYRPESGERLRVWNHPRQPQITSTSISSDGKRVWLAAGRSVFRWNLETDHTDVFDLGEGTRIGATVSTPTGGLVSVRWMDHGHDAVATLDASTGRMVRAFRSPDGFGKFSSDGIWFVERIDGEAKTWLKTLRLTHLPTGKQSPVFPDRAVSLSGTISPDGKYLWVGSNPDEPPRWTYPLFEVLREGGIAVPEHFGSP